MNAGEWGNGAVLARAAAQALIGCRAGYRGVEIESSAPYGTSRRVI